MLPNHKRNHTQCDGPWKNLEQGIRHFLIRRSIIGRLVGTTIRWVRISQVKAQVVFNHSQLDNPCRTFSFFLVWVRVTVHTIYHNLIAGKQREIFPSNCSQNAWPRDCKYIIVANTRKSINFSMYFTPTWSAPVKYTLQWVTAPEFLDRFHQNKLCRVESSSGPILHFVFGWARNTLHANGLRSAAKLCKHITSYLLDRYVNLRYIR